MKDKKILEGLRKYSLSAGIAEFLIFDLLRYTVKRKVS